MSEEAQAIITALIFVGVAIGLGGLAVWGFLALNAVAAISGSIGEAAWFWAGRHILGHG